MKKTISTLFLSAALIALVGCGEPNKNEASSAMALSHKADSPAPYPVTDAERNEALNMVAKSRAHMLELEGKIIAPAQEDLAQHAELLKDPSAGVARIFLRGSGDPRRPLLINGEGAYYQFKGRTNAYGYGNDLEYSSADGPTFSVGFAGVDYGFIGQLGKIDITSVDERNPVLQYALNYPSMNGQKEPAWRQEQRKWNDGVTVGDVKLKDYVPAIVGMTYVVRSINESGYDVVVIFQVVRRDPSDGSLILAWKLLKELEKPVLNRQ